MTLPTVPSLGQKVTDAFGRFAIDKSRLPASQLKNFGLPTYVAEWVLDTLVPGFGPLTPAEVAKLAAFAADRLPPPGDQFVIKNRILHGERVKVLASVRAESHPDRKKKGLKEFAVLDGLKIGEAGIAPALLAEHRDLLRRGMWGVTELGLGDEGIEVLSFRPMQGRVNLDLYREARRTFSLAEWRSLLLTSLGFVASALTDEQQTMLLCRLLPLVQKNMHLMELAPKGTGKSYFFENISPRVRLVSGSVTPAVLFVNNATGQWGILAQFSTVVLDEVQTLSFSNPDEVVGGLKSYLANNKITRGGRDEAPSDCSLVLLANIELDDQQRPRRAVYVEEMPPFLRETAFLDRFKGLIPGWELPKLSPHLLVGPDTRDAVGLKADAFSDTLLALRETTEADRYCAEHVQLAGEKPFLRNVRSVQALAAGLMKLQFPHNEVTPDEFRRYCLEPALKLRGLIWEQMYQRDPEQRQWDRYLVAAT